ncbi:sodium/potassium/calcium exchanger 6, mitochondrial [Drosophila serrata]|uniref:sodium/potassium/calcium exchanger 6, mitochondrial n=1 Tax=Drosophila serrata TaxID=7274 RepID=UPI000A1D1E9F|nr:sodium/potassium/calcium exchanger 6, mitochondrial [Drosophila serrata]
MATKLNPLDDEFTFFWERVSCFVAREIMYEDKCDFVRRAVDCNRSTNVVPYMFLMSCKLQCINAFQEHCLLALFVTMSFMMLALLMHVVYSYYGPALKTVSKLIHMNEHLAGVTILAFGNSSADLFVHLANVRSKVPVFSASICSALFVAMVSGGLVCYINPFRMDGFETVRDILFLIFGMSLVNFYLLRPMEVSAMEFVGMFMVYFLYILVNILDLYLMRREITILKAKIEKLEENDYSFENEVKLYSLRRTLDRFQDHKLQIYEKRNSRVSLNIMDFATKRMATYKRVSVNMEKNRNIMYDIRRGKNHRLLKDFLLELRAIKCSDWRKANMIGRALLIAKAPLVLICILYIPLVDYEMKKHGWKKLLNILHVVVNPSISVMVFSSLLTTPSDKLWYIEMKNDYKYGVYTIMITMPFAVVIYYTSRTDRPPRYHWAFAIMNLTGCMILIYVCATEIDRVMAVVSRNLELDEEFMSASVKSWTNNLGTVVANTAMAMYGYPKMAYASAIGGPIFTLVMSPSIVLFVRKMLNEPDESSTEFGDYGHNAFYFLLFGLLCTLLWTTTLGFFARRSMGIFSITLYVIYIIYTKLIHAGVIHSFGYDRRLKAAFGNL